MSEAGEKEKKGPGTGDIMAFCGLGFELPVEFPAKLSQKGIS